MKYLLCLFLFMGHFVNAQLQLNITHKNAKGGKMPIASFKTATSFIFRNSIGCEIQSFEFIGVGKNKTPYSILNLGTKFNKEILQIIKNANPGDTFYFENFRFICPGDDRWVLPSKSIDFSLF
jgi:GldM C-terminal domain